MPFPDLLKAKQRVAHDYAARCHSVTCGGACGRRPTVRKPLTEKCARNRARNRRRAPMQRASRKANR
jgi:hypothetical protein